MLTSQDYSPSSVVCEPKPARAIWRYLPSIGCYDFVSVGLLLEICNANKFVFKLNPNLRQAWRGGEH